VNARPLLAGLQAAEAQAGEVRADDGNVLAGEFWR